MAVDPEIRLASISELRLDNKNPRLGRENTTKNLPQEQVLRLMEGWTLEELAVSFLESGFWPQEAVIAVEEPVKGQASLVVVEGNRRLAALIQLFRARNGNPASDKWVEIAKSGTKKAFDRLERIPYVRADSREDVEAYLGFRHVTGIKEWNPAEKAEFISHLIDDLKMSYEEVRRRIGSKAPTVRQHYISYRLLLQMEEVEEIALENVEEKFSILYLSLRSSGTQAFLGIDIEAEPAAAKRPVPKSKTKALKEFALWLFGDEKRQPVVKESRFVDKFGEILASEPAVDYLRRAERPSFETAYRIAGGGESEALAVLGRAADNLEEALGTIHHHLKSKAVHKVVRRVGLDALTLLDKFPAIEQELRREREGR